MNIYHRVIRQFSNIVVKLIIIPMNQFSSKLSFSIFFNPKRALAKLLLKVSCILSDKQFVQLSFFYYMGYPVDLKDPTTFCEKLQWLKLYNRKPEYTQMVDKYWVKKYVASKIGKQYIIPTLGVWDRPDDIDWNILPNKFVLKTTHGGGGNGVIICEDKEHFNKMNAVKALKKALSIDLYKKYREWPYKNVCKRVIAEAYIGEKNDELKNHDLNDYKFFCFNGRVKFFKIDFGRFVDHHANYYLPNGDLLPFGEEICPPKFDADVVLPPNISKMIEVAELLSTSIPFLRVDLYNVNNRIFFGELTFYPAAGLGRFTPLEWEKTLGEYINLPFNLDYH